MNLKYLAAAGAASLLMAGAAFAQGTSQPSPPNTTGSGSAATGATVNPSPNTSATTDQSTSTSTSSGVTTSSTTTSADVAGQNASVTTQTVAMSPIPDTPANRAKYGGPMSRAGKRTAPRGN